MINENKTVQKKTLMTRQKAKLKIKEDKRFSKWIIKNNKPHKKEKGINLNIFDDEIIKFKNVNKYISNKYNNLQILKDINLTIKAGEFVVIYGPSGSGKTTLLTLISGLDRPTTGTSFIVGKNSISLSEHDLTVFRKKNVGYIFQQYGLLNELSVYDNVKIAANLQSDKSKRLNIKELLQDVDMWEHRHKKAHNLSGGQAQRVAICRAIVKNPKILFGDEPTGALHVDATKQILKIFKKINHDFKTTVIIVTHNEKMLDIADHVIKVHDGKIILDYYNETKKEVEDIKW